jgi:hypothetical protein
MPGTELNTLFKHIQRVAAAPAAALPDRFLLEQFLAERNEAAFRELLRRHAPMVLGVCRSLLRQEQDAEDAFQATCTAWLTRSPAICWPACGDAAGTNRGLPRCRSPTRSWTSPSASCTTP